MSYFTAKYKRQFLGIAQNACTLLVLLAAMTTSLFAQDNFFSRWESRASSIQARQPGWSSPLVASYPMLVQNFRTDFLRQVTPTHTDTWNYGGSRGLYLIPGFHSEVDVYYPPYLQHSTPKTKDGFGDMGFQYKYRILSRNQEGGNYMLSGQLAATIPTGSHSNGSTDASINPTLSGGKGFGRFDVISALGGTLPAKDTLKLGRSIAWNTAAQYHLGKYLWPEVEANTTHYVGGKNNGKTQNFVTPGLTTSKFKFHPDDVKSRLAIVAGAGMQIATSTYHSYNHELVFTSRLVF
jgi:hypothetical protein